jgi:hypothetical protein
MKRAIVARGDFLYHVQLESVRTPKGMFQLVLSSQWRQAKDPDAEHIKASLLLDAEGLRQLRQLVDDALELSQEGGVA